MHTLSEKNPQKSRNRTGQIGTFVQGVPAWALDRLQRASWAGRNRNGNRNRDKGTIVMAAPIARLKRQEKVDLG